MRLIYMDHNATTPMDPRVLEAMLPYMTEHFGNASSVSHPFGLDAADAVNRAREQVAAVLGCSVEEVLFTSGATESDNTAIKGVAWSAAKPGGHIITTRIEHRAVLESCRFLERQGFRITFVGTDAEGIVDPDDVKKAMTPDTILVSVMHANSEIGTIQPVEAIGAIAREAGVAFHVDATQTFGRSPWTLPRSGRTSSLSPGTRSTAPRAWGGST